MHKLTAGLALSTLGLAVISIYLWTELRDARARVESLSSDSTVVPMPIERPTPHDVHSTGPAAPMNDAAYPATASSQIDDAKSRQDVYEADYRDAARQRLAQLSDPSMRAQMLEEWTEANLRDKATYARYLDINDADAERLIDVLAERFLDQSEAYARCTLQPPCDYQAVSREAGAARQSALTDLLGPERTQRFEQYTYTKLERGLLVHFLRDRIPAGSELSEVESERFIAALADERRLVETEIKQRGLEPFSYPMEGVAFTFENSPFQPGSSGDRLKEAADYNRRIHARAKGILTPKQLAAFEQMQEAAIVGLKFWLRQQERDLATRTAAPEWSN